MSQEESYPLISLDQNTKAFVKKGKETNSQIYKSKTKDVQEKTNQPLQRSSSFQRQLGPNLEKLRNRLRKLSCFKGEDDDLPNMDVPRHKSIDIGVGVARRMSHFIFTRKTVCVHPYHPYTPSQTTRKIYVFAEDKD